MFGFDANALFVVLDLTNIFFFLFYSCFIYLVGDFGDSEGLAAVNDCLTGLWKSNCRCGLSWNPALGLTSLDIDVNDLISFFSFPFVENTSFSFECVVVELIEMDLLGARYLQ